jgi:hypothetical protein
MLHAVLNRMKCKAEQRAEERRTPGSGLNSESVREQAI